MAGKGDADGEGLYQGCMTPSFDREMFPVDARLQDAVDGIQKIVTVILNMKADQVRTQHSVKKLPLPGADTEGFWVGPGNMPEKSHAGIRSFFLDETGQKGEMVVLD